MPFNPSEYDGRAEDFSVVAKPYIINSDNGQLEQHAVPMSFSEENLEYLSYAIEKLDKEDPAETTALIRHHLPCPIILFQKNSPELLPEEVLWSFLNHDPYRERISIISQSVGRIEIRKPNQDDDSEGTGFLVAKDIIMTNRHVARDLCWDKFDIAKNESGKWLLTVDACIDFDEQFGGGEREFKIIGVEHVYEDKKIDLALLRIEVKENMPLPLTLASERPSEEDLLVSVIGYPKMELDSDYQSNLERLFPEDLRNCKCLQPGLVVDKHINAVDSIGNRGKEFFHTCSTLPNNSGSCIINLNTGEVLGIHYWGIEGKYNMAVKLWKLQKHNLMKRLFINYSNT